MSDFVPEGKTDHFANVYSDSQEIHSVAEWSQERLDYKTNEYGQFLQREDLMPRAVKAANTILDYLLFEQQYRDNDIPGQWVDEVCDGDDGRTAAL